MNHNKLTHADRLRRFAAAVIVVIAAILLASCSPQAEQRMPAAAQEQTATVTVPTDTAVPTNTPAPTSTPTPVPTPTLDPCPMQPERWTFNLQKDTSGNVYRNNYRMLTPTCAYDNLLPWLAYAMMIQNGYSMEEAARTLGLDDHPYFNGFRYKEGVPPKYVYWFHLQAEEDLYRRALWGLYGSAIPTDTRLWLYNRESGDYTPNKFVIHGCTPNVRAGVRDGLGNEEIVYFKAVCSILKFFPGYQSSYLLIKMPDGNEYPNVGVQTLPNDEMAFTKGPHGGGQNYAKPNQPAYASLLFFAYTGDGRWWYLGEDNRFELRSYISVESMNSSIEFFHDLQPQMPVFDIQWLKDTYGIEPRPLPERAEEAIQRFENDPVLSENADKAYLYRRDYAAVYLDENLKK